MRRLSVLAVWFSIITAAGWWLFADTVRYYRGSSLDEKTIRFCHWGSYQEYHMWKTPFGKRVERQQSWNH